MKRILPLLLIISLSSLFSGCAITGTALTTASYKGQTDVVKDILNKGADVNERSGCGWGWDPSVTALTCAAHGGHMETVKVLVERGADVNARSGAGWTPLASAVYAGHADIVKLLIEKGADVSISIGSETALQVAKREGNTLIIRILQEAEEEIYQRKYAKVEKPSSSVIPESSATIRSDVDKLPVMQAKPNKNAYAIVIGVEKYRQKLPKADFARQDATVMAKYLEKVMGYPGENIVTLLDDRASFVDFAKYFEKWLPNNVEENSTVFVYYSGHGAPNPKTGDAYLVPYDGDPSFIEETGYPLKRLYAKLDKLPAKEIIVVLDSCFSGAGGRSVLAKGARPLVMNMDKQVSHSDRIAVFSASSGSQISSTHEEKGHGLFTYFFLKGIKDGNSELGALYYYLKPQVESTARKTYNNEQTPGLTAPRGFLNLRLYSR